MGYRTEEQKAKRREYEKKERATNPEKYRTRHKNWRDKNKDNLQAYRDENREKIRARDLKDNLGRYGLTPQQYNEMLEQQNFKCKICGAEKSGSKRADRLFVDHCHKTNKVRGLLCQHCNMSLGGFRDNPDLLQRASQYLYNQMTLDELIDEAIFNTT